MCNVSMIVIYCVVYRPLNCVYKNNLHDAGKAYKIMRQCTVRGDDKTKLILQQWNSHTYKYSQNLKAIRGNIVSYIYIQFIKINDIEHILATVSTLWWGHINTTFPLKHKTDLWVKIQNYASFKICGSY